jgi:hypothetical protein
MEIAPPPAPTGSYEAKGILNRPMTQKDITLVLVCALVVLVCCCPGPGLINWAWSTRTTAKERAMMDQLYPGMTRAEAQAILGQPDSSFAEARQRPKFNLPRNFEGVRGPITGKLDIYNGKIDISIYYDEEDRVILVTYEYPST